MKILLIQPPVEDFYDTDIRLQPIGLGYLKAAILKEAPGHVVKVLDLHQGWGRRTARIPKELVYLQNYYGLNDRSPFCGFHNYFRFGAPDKAIADILKKEKPDLIGISSLFSPYYREALRVAEIAKQVSNAKIVMGGSHVSAFPESLLSSPHVDFVIKGEGERPIVELIKFLDGEIQIKDVSSLGFKEDGRICWNEVKDNFNLNDLNPPDLSDLSMNNYLYEGKPLTFMVTSRSCPHRCSFCSVHNTFGFKYRRRSISNVLEEIKLRYEQGYRVIDFEDDNLTFFVKEMKELCRELIRMFPKKDMEFVAMNGISYLSLDQELLVLMKEAGFKKINLSLVSSDKSVLETTKRPHTVDRYLHVVGEAHKLGFKITSYQILGLPFENIDSMVQTLIFAAQQPVLLGASMFYMTPHSPIAKTLDYPATLENTFKARLTSMAIETENFDRDDIYTLFICTRIINFLKVDPHDDKRAKKGFLIFNYLLKNRVLLADTPQGLKPLIRFKVDLFFKLWSNLKYVTKFNGQKYYLPIENYQGENLTI